MNSPEVMGYAEKDAMEILLKFLDKKAREAEEEVAQKGVLSDDKAIPLILKTQFNRIAHLEKTVNERFAHVDRRFAELRGDMDRKFERMELRFDRLQRNMLGGFAVLGVLISILRFAHS